MSFIFDEPFSMKQLNIMFPLYDGDYQLSKVLYGFVVVTFLWLSVAMTWICLKVYKYDINQTNSRQITSQTVQYVMAFTIPWIFNLVLSYIDEKEYFLSSYDSSDTITAISIVDAIIFPLQGLFNALVYMRPRYYKMKSKHPDLSFIELLKKVIWKQKVSGQPSMTTFEFDVAVSDDFNNQTGIGESNPFASNEEKCVSQDAEILK
mmetsp:Transcript_56863/g.66481  ORF Transcript_56863/g.66481 Transcript_56863/m.66481 type:complete len:206 (-) Transcript_56863:54-671(-)